MRWMRSTRGLCAGKFILVVWSLQQTRKWLMPFPVLKNGTANINLDSNSRLANSLKKGLSKERNERWRQVSHGETRTKSSNQKERQCKGPAAVTGVFTHQTGRHGGRQASITHVIIAATQWGRRYSYPRFGWSNWGVTIHPSPAHMKHSPRQTTFWAIKHILTNIKGQKSHAVYPQTTMELNYLDFNNRKNHWKIQKHVESKQHTSK